jgi:hypothetical protein
MSVDDVSDLFAETYAEARAKFLLEVARAGGVTTNYVHPVAFDPRGGSLAIDVACFGREGAKNAFLVLSGTHGGEGYAGSAAQIALVKTGALAALGPDVRVVLVHGINPYGFAHWTRTTENNVDLNRNFIDFGLELPGNPGYGEVHQYICPRHWTPESRDAAKLGTDTWITRNGFQAWIQTIMMGQYNEPTGLNYGGRSREWSNLTLEQIARAHLYGVEKLAFIDWHTGLGKYAEPFFLCFNEPQDANWERACKWWGRDRVETKDGFEGAARPRYSGLVFHGVQRFVYPAAMTGAVIEFGTLPVAEAFDQLRIDRWLKFGDRPRDTALTSAMRLGVRDAFTPPDPEWRRRIVAHARDIQLQALEGVSAW